jgi:hypothetical protein
MQVNDVHHIDQTLGKKSDAFLQQEIEKLSSHPLYSKLTCLRSLQIFMSYHVLAVWDFMSLLKSLQNHLTCTSLPWRPSPYPKELVRMINEIVLGEESDLDQKGYPCDHFSLYRNAMKEVNASTVAIDKILTKCNQFSSFNQDCIEHIVSELEGAAGEFVSANLHIACSAPVHQVAAAFFYGREKAIPSMFEGITGPLKETTLNCPTLIYYLDRHIELDGDEHSHLAGQCLEILCQGDEKKWKEAHDVAYQSLQKRSALWDQALNEISQIKSWSAGIN